MNKYEQLLTNIISDQTISFISSISKDGYPIMRAMLLPCKREGNIFYYHTNTSSTKIQQFMENPKACIYFCDANTFQGLLFRGTMEVLQDNQTKLEFWKDGYTMYYSQGVTDPDYCVLRFTAIGCDAYQSFQVTSFEV